MPDGTLFKFKDDIFVVKHIINSEVVGMLPNIKINLIAYDENEKPFSMIASKENKDIFFLIGFKLFDGIKIKVPHYKCYSNGKIKYIPAYFLEEIK